jgi:5-methylcytosine-specific restriction enzyme A
MVLAQTLFAKEKRAGEIYTEEQKLEVIEQLENTSTREAKKIVAEINPEMGKKPGLDFNSIEDDVLREKLLRIKGMYAHAHPNMTFTELLNKLCDEKIEEQMKSPAAPQVASETHARRTVWSRDNYQCVNCGSTQATEIDHIQPQAMGGESTVENMHVLCRSCNQRWAIECYGDKKMSQFLKEPVKNYSAMMRPTVKYSAAPLH